MSRQISGWQEKRKLIVLAAGTGKHVQPAPAGNLHYVLGMYSPWGKGDKTATCRFNDGLHNAWLENSALHTAIERHNKAARVMVVQKGMYLTCTLQHKSICHDVVKKRTPL